MDTLDIDQEQNIFTVSRLNNEVHFLLEDTYPAIWVEGEISNFAAPHSGHWYFCLKDASAQVKCALFRSNQRKLGFTPKDGSQVLIRARVSLYENRGEFQLIADLMEERGEGKLRRAYEVLKKKLEAAGLFATEHKKALPLYPRCIGVITSATGAAIHDILNVLKRRHAAIPIIIYPTSVQGEGAAAQIVKAIQLANARQECDVLILARGGGSLEDLWSFNEEIVAHAIFASALPIVSGVGHEVDFTIADFVADLRAPTPSAAAELVAPDTTQLLQLLSRQTASLHRSLKQKLLQKKEQLIWMQKHLSQQHPKRRLLEKMQKLDFYELALVQLQHRLLQMRESQLKQLQTHLYQHFPLHKVLQKQNQLNLYRQKLLTLMALCLQKRETQLASHAVRLDALSPLATLGRGFSIVTKNSQLLTNTKGIKIGDEVEVRLWKGSMKCMVKEKI